MDKNYPTQIELQKLKSELLFGEISEIAKRVGCHRTTVVRALEGYTNNPRILSEAVSVIKQRKEAMSKLKRSINTL